MIFISHKHALLVPVVIVLVTIVGLIASPVREME